MARSDIHGTRAAVLRHAFSIAKEAARHLLRRPVAGVALAAHDEHGRWLLIRRSDTGAWAFVGGTLEWGETMRVCAERELQEEAGARLLGIEAIVGVYTDPARDPRFHAATTVLRCLIASDVLGARNPLEIRGVRFVSASELRALARDGSLSHGMGDMAEAALSDGPPVIE